MENQIIKCADCKKEYKVEQLLQVRDKFPDQPKYKMVCELCYNIKTMEKESYVYVGCFKI